MSGILFMVPVWWIARHELSTHFNSICVFRDAFVKLNDTKQ